MPYLSEKKKLSRDQDRRYKLTEDNRELIRKRHQEGESMRALSREYKVDRKTIKACCYPEWYKEELNKHKQYMKQYRQTIDKNQHNEYTKSHRKYKQDLHLKGELYTLII